MTRPTTRSAAATPTVEIPADAPRVSQDAETALVGTDHDGRREVRLHDYAALFATRGLYEAVFSELLDCDSPRVVTADLARALQHARVDPATVRALDLGAGNGLAAEHLARLGVPDIVGLDRLPEAARAARRDRPGLYRDYLVGDVTTTDRSEVADTAGRAPNLLVCVAALGFDDIPVQAFSAALDLLEPASWAAFNIKSAFLDDSDRSGFAALLDNRLTGRTGQRRLTVLHERSYIHRRSQAGEALRYTSIVARTV